MKYRNGVTVETGDIISLDGEIALAVEPMKSDPDFWLVYSKDRSWRTYWLTANCDFKGRIKLFNPHNSGQA